MFGHASPHSPFQSHHLVSKTTFLQVLSERKKKRKKEGKNEQTIEQKKESMKERREELKKE